MALLHITAWLASALAYLVLLVITGGILAISCIALLSQAVRTSPNRNWKNNENAIVIGGAYIIVIVASAAFWVKRRLSVVRTLQRIPKTHVAIRQGEVPKTVHEFIEREYLRTCLITYESQPTGIVQEGWGVPGTPYEGVYFRRALLDTIPTIDKAAQSLLGSDHPILRPHKTMEQHFRLLQPYVDVKFTVVEPYRRMTALAFYDAAIQMARYGERELSEEEFTEAMRAATTIHSILEELNSRPRPSVS